MVGSSVSDSEGDHEGVSEPLPLTETVELVVRLDDTVSERVALRSRLRLSVTDRLVDGDDVVVMDRVDVAD